MPVNHILDIMAMSQCNCVRWYYRTAAGSNRSQVAWATRSSSPSERIVDLATARRLPSLISRASARRSPRRRLAQEIDVEIGGHGERHPADRRQDRDINGEIGKRHHGRAGNRAARAQRACGWKAAGPGSRHAKPRSTTSHFGVEHLRKLGPQPAIELLDRAASPAPCHFMTLLPVRPLLRIGYNETAWLAKSARKRRNRENAGPMSAHAATASAAAASSLILLREDVAGVAVLTLNRPQTRNSLSEAMLEALGDALTAIAARCQRARGRARRQRPGVLRRPRPQGDRQPPRRPRPRPRLFQAHHGRRAAP